MCEQTRQFQVFFLKCIRRQGHQLRKSEERRRHLNSWKSEGMKEVCRTDSLCWYPFEICGYNFKGRKSAQLLDFLQNCSAVPSGLEQAELNVIGLVILQMCMTGDKGIKGDFKRVVIVSGQGMYTCPFSAPLWTHVPRGLCAARSPSGWVE